MNTTNLLLLTWLCLSFTAAGQQRLRALPDAPCAASELTSVQGTAVSITGRNPLQLHVQTDAGVQSWRLTEPLNQQAIRLRSAPFPGTSQDFIQRLSQQGQPAQVVLWWCRGDPQSIIIDLY